MKAEKQIKIGKFTAIIMCVLHGILLLMLVSIVALSLVSGPRRLTIGAQLFYIGYIGILFSLYAVFGYAVIHRHNKTCIGILVILYLAAFMFGVSRAIEHLVLLIVAFIPIGYLQLWRQRQTFWYVYMIIMPVAMCLLLYSVFGAYKEKKQRSKVKKDLCRMS